MMRSARLLLAGTTLALACVSSIAGTPNLPPPPELVNFRVSERAAVRAAYYDSLRTQCSSGILSDWPG
jgi:hypothetical protein